MKIKTYRICLLSILILIVIGGVFYLMNSSGSDFQAVDGTFVSKIMSFKPIAAAGSWLNYGR